MNVLKAVGDPALRRWRFASGIASVAWGVLFLAGRPSYWRRTVRRELAKQILFTGIDALGLTLLIAVLAGISVVAQVQLWLTRLGQSEMLGSILVTVLVREVGPVLVSVLVIGRSGTAIATELAIALKAEKLILLTSTLGVLEDANDPMSLISHIDSQLLEEIIAQNAKGGMKVKLEACRNALRGGVPRTHIISGLKPDSLLLEIFTNEGSCTLIEQKKVNDPFNESKNL